MTLTAPENPGLIRSWLAFTRPKTWLIAVSPVIASLALAWSETKTFAPLTALFTISIAILMQAISNMENDLGYAERNAERGNRRGLPRATTMGWISLPTARIAIRIGALLALINTAVLIWIGGWVFLLIGLASLIAAYSYMGGPKPIAYTPFGELVVLVLFGLTAVCGTYFLQTGSISTNACLLGLALRSIASGVLALNNFRDYEHDSSIGRNTLAVVIGKPGFLKLFHCLMLVPYAALVIMGVNSTSHWPILIAFATLPLAVSIAKNLAQKEHEALNAVMFGCVKLEGIFSLLFAAGCILAVFVEKL